MKSAHNDAPFHVLLVENNPYDRAVIDACFEQDPAATLQYTIRDGDGGLRAIAPTDLWDEALWLNNSIRPDVVLLDLALTKQCEIMFADASYREFLRNRPHHLKRAAAPLAKWSPAEQRIVIEVTLLLLQAEGGDESAAQRARALLKQVSPDSRCAVDASAQPAQIVDALWGLLVADTIRGLARAPSLLRIFALIAAFPTVCFGVISHYADDDTRLALRTILGLRNSSPDQTQLDNLVDALIINKAELLSRASDGTPLDLPQRLRAAFHEWELNQSPESIVAPYARLRVMGPNKRMIELWECVDWVWPDALERQKTAPASEPADEATNYCILLWDETRVLAGRPHAWRAEHSDGHLGWKAIFNKHFITTVGLDVDSVDLLHVYPGNERPVLYVVRSAISNSAEAEDFAGKLRTAFPRAASTSFVVLGGTSAAREALAANLAAEPGVSLYYIPDWNSDVWSGRWYHRLVQTDGKATVFREMSGALRIAQNGHSSPRLLKDALARAVGGKAPKLLQSVADVIAASATPFEEWERFSLLAPTVLQELENGTAWETVLREHRFWNKTTVLGKAS